MSLIEIHRPSKREISVFGLLLILFFGLVGALVWWKADSPTAAKVLWGVGGSLVLTYYAVPPLRLVMYYGWMMAAYPIGWTVSHIVMLITFYLVITPIGLAMRLFGHDPMHRQFDRDAATYWIRHQTSDDISRYFRQF